MTGRPRPELCVGAVVVRAGDLLLVRRGQAPAAGQWSVPGGRVEGGETMAQATAREVVEETGVTVVVGEPIGWVERIGQDHHHVIVDFRATAVEPGAPLRPGDDATEAAWVPLGEVPEIDLVPGLLDFLTRHGVVPVAPGR